VVDSERLLQTLVVTETGGNSDVQVAVQGGGLSGQANALNHYNPDLSIRITLKVFHLWLLIDNDVTETGLNQHARSRRFASAASITTFSFINHRRSFGFETIP